jgi:hypothetical protein
LASGSAHVLLARGACLSEERFWRDVGAVGPHDGAALDEAATEFVQVFERLERRAGKPPREAQRGLGAVVEPDENRRRY